jgi:hypothetical protein
MKAESKYFKHLGNVTLIVDAKASNTQGLLLFISQNKQ